MGTIQAFNWWSTSNIVDGLLNSMCNPCASIDATITKWIEKEGNIIGSLPKYILDVNSQVLRQPLHDFSI